MLFPSSQPQRREVDEGRLGRLLSAGRRMCRPTRRANRCCRRRQGRARSSLKLDSVRVGDVRHRARAQPCV
eukprot:5947776-Pleurochrysis_carterae.AAC.1